MKKVLYLLLLLSPWITVYAQCIPDQNLSTPGLYPPAGSSTDTTAIILPDAAVNQAVSYVTQVVVLADTIVSLGGFSFNVPVDSLGIVSLTGLPAGMNYACDVPNCTWEGGDNGCIEVSGTPTTLGTYNIIATAKTKIVVTGLLDTSVLTPFVFKLNVVAGASIFEERPISFRIDPNPATSFVDIRVNRGEQLLQYRLFDLLGRPVEEGEFKPIEGHYRLSVESVKNGVYLLHIGNSEGWSSQRLLIAR